MPDDAATPPPPAPPPVPPVAPPPLDAVVVDGAVVDGFGSIQVQLAAVPLANSTTQSSFIVTVSV